MYTQLHLGGKGNKPPQLGGNVVCVCVRACAAFVPFIKYCSAQNAGDDFSVAWSS
jgi:hypothetical protein